MSNEVWARVDDHFASLRDPDPVLESALSRSASAGLPDISVSPEQGRLLTLLAHGVGARAILEIGTLGGYSAICLARALPPDGRLVTLEAEADHARVARENIEAAGLDDRVEVVVGPASSSLPRLEDEYPAGFDFIFIDADKEGYPEYWRWAMRLSHPGAMIIADNVVRDGAVADPDSDDPRVHGVRRYLELAAAEARVHDATVQTVGNKGYDGLSIAVVTGGSTEKQGSHPL